MKAPIENQRRPLDIRSAAELFQALSSSNMMIRLSVLQNISRHPKQALAYGRHDGADIIDGLIAEASRRGSVQYRKMVLSALVRFDDRRACAVFEHELCHATDPAIVELAAKRIAVKAGEEQRGLLESALWLERKPDCLAAIARSVCGFQNLSQRTKVRLAALQLSVADTPAALDSVSIDDWLRELDDVFALGARRAVAALGEPALRVLWDHSDRLSVPSFGWLVERSLLLRLDHASGIAKALRVASPEIQRTALDWLNSVGSDRASVDLVRRLVDSPVSAVRCRAYRCLPWNDIDWRELSLGGEAPTIRALAIERWAATWPEAEAAMKADLKGLVGCLEDPDWRIRAAAVRSLVVLGEPGELEARKLISHPAEDVRAAAIRVLIERKQENWVVDQLLA